MPPKPPMSLQDARTRIDDMLEGLSSEKSPGFSRRAIDRSIKVVEAVRLNKDGQVADEEQVKKGKFFGKVRYRMLCTETMANMLDNMHGGCVATIVDNLTSLAIYLHIANTEAETPWAFLGVTQSLQVVYLAAVPVGEWVEIEVNVLSLGARVVAVGCDMYLLDGEDGERIKKTSNATHTKIDNSLSSKI
ncbi:unnamed protein product [Parajaminaea phylloscopi]